MEPKLVQEYRAKLYFPQATYTITHSDLTALQTEIANVCKQHGFNPKWDSQVSETTIFVNDQNGSPIGRIAQYDVQKDLSLGSRRAA